MYSVGEPSVAKRKYLQLVEYEDKYAIHEALIDTEESLEPYWVGSEPLKVFSNYHEAIEFWSIYEKMSGVLDILTYDVVEPLFDRVDYSDITELNFD